MIKWISGDSHRRFIVSLLVAAVVFWSLRARVAVAIEVMSTWDAFAISVLFLVWLMIVVTPQEKLRVHAKAQDLSRFVISTFVVIAACAALFAVAFVIKTHHAEMRNGLTSYVVLALATVAVSWTLLHTVFSLHYAHVFYGDDETGGAHGPAGGLEFPGDEKPDYSDFAYFSFVVGMTCQVSDVQVTSRTMRQITLVHGVLSFGYNTVILAFLINTVSGLL